MRAMKLVALALLAVGCSHSWATGAEQSPISDAPVDSYGSDASATPASSDGSTGASDTRASMEALLRFEPLGSCAEYGFFALQGALSVVNGRSIAPDFDRANAAANTDYDAAMNAAEQHDMSTAAWRFLACAGRYRTVPAGAQLRSPSVSNAQSCYRNALMAFAMAGQLASDGRRAFEEAAISDPLMASFIHELLADPPVDCKVRPPE